MKIVKKMEEHFNINYFVNNNRKNIEFTYDQWKKWVDDVKKEKTVSWGYGFIIGVIIGIMITRMMIG